MSIYRRFNRTRSYSLLRTTIFLIGFTLSPAHAQIKKQVDFYLPVISKQNINIIQRLNSALADAGLKNINIIKIGHWQQYQQAVRHGRSGFYLSPPHFNAWLQHTHNFKPIAKFKGTLSYVIISNTSNTSIFEIRDLVNKKICAQQPLNLDYLLISQAFAKNVQSAQAHIVDSVNNELLNNNSPCNAFSISEYSFKKLEQTHPNKYIRLMQGPRFSNYGVLADPTISAEVTNQFKSFLAQPDVQKALKPLFENISPDGVLIKTNNSDYLKSDSKSLSKYWLN